MSLRPLQRKFVFLIIRCLLLVFFALGVKVWADDSNSQTSVITIVNANKTEYVKDSVTKEEQIVLTGAVVVEVAQGSVKTKISASKISYNRETNILYAQGDVVMEQTGGKAGEQKITAQTVLFNTLTYEGIFDGGRVIQTQSDAINLPSGSTLVVSSSMFGKNSENTIVFKNASLTFCDDENPHWKIRATKIWVLPGGEFAFFNAMLFIGEIPVLYLPAFYYPKDEIIFNPTFGYDTRRGYYFQSTTYIYGRKPLEADSTSSSEDDDKDDELGKGLYNFMKPTKLKEQRREGIVLHNLDEDYTGDTSNYLKLMFDHYSTLGTMVGFDAVFKPEKYLSSFNANLNLGFSNTVFMDSTGEVYTPYSSAGESYKDKANLLGIKTPFRYSGNLAVSGTSPFNFKVSMPIYSDPYFTDDFGERTEYMDWISFLTRGAKDEDDDEDEDKVSVSSYTWNASASHSFNIPDYLKPFLQNVSITDISSSVIFNSKTNTAIASEATDDWYLYTPERMFFYPSQVTPLKFSANVAGSIIKYPLEEKRSKPVSFPYELSVPEEFSDAKKKDGNAESEVQEDKDQDKVNDGSVLGEKDLPSLNVRSDIRVTNISDIDYELKYSVTPQFTSQFAYDSTKLSKPDDFKWSERQSSYYQVTSPVVLTSGLSFRDSMFGMKNVLTYTPLYQTHPSLDGYSDADAATVRKTDYQARKNDLNVDNGISVKPLIYNEVFKDSSIDWNTSIRLVRTQFIGDEEHPEWDYLTADLTDEESVTEHTLSATLSAEEGKDFSQRLILSTTLPPQKDKYEGNLRFTFPYTELTFASGFEKIEETVSNDVVENWRKLPFKQSASLKFLDGKFALTQSYNYNLEEHYSDSFKAALSYGGLQVAYTAAYTYGYDFDEESGWTIRSDREFLPETFSIAYTSGQKNFRYWKRRVTWAPSLNTSIVYDCIRPTNSYFKFIPAVTFKINNFVNLTFSSESRNSVIYRYIQDYTHSGINLPGETNVFKDLLNSFAFWGDDSMLDEEQTKRRSSGFKLKNLKATLSHDLHDWDLISSFEVKPRLITKNDGSKSYNFDPYISISIVWRPMNAMKTEIVDEYGELKLNP